MSASPLQQARPAGNTVTDPIWADICVAIVVVLGAITLFAVVDSVLRAAMRKWQQRLDLELWQADVETNQLQRAEADRMLRTPPVERCLHRYGPWVCTAAPHADEPRRHYFVNADRGPSIAS